jgi:hypothetical protein
MTTQPSDEDVLIQAARAERGEQQSGRSMGASLGVAIALAAVGGVLVFVPRVISVLLPGPLRLLGGFGIPVLVIVGIVAFAIAGLFLLSALASSPLASWGSAVPGSCPQCGESRLRSDTVPGPTAGSPKDAPRGIVTLCPAPAARRPPSTPASITWRRSCRGE